MDEDLKSRLGELAYDVTQHGATEKPFTGEHLDNHQTGTYHCVVCDEPLFESETKFESGSGWPSFTDPANESCIATKDDHKFLMRRTEVLCKSCNAHLGHLFNDGPNGKKRYCINSASLTFKLSS